MSQPIEHSPGPWKVKDGCVCDSSGFPVVSPMGGSEPGDQTAANLRLIAEAPEMYGVLRQICSTDWEEREQGLRSAQFFLQELEGRSDAEA